MRLSDLLFGCFQFLLPPAIILTSLLYLYPAVQQCKFPEARPSVAACHVNGTPAVAAEKAPFRLLTLADPQLEGDTSIPHHPGLQLFDLDRWRYEGVGRFKSLVKEDVPRVLQGYRKRLDLWGNDLYLAHIYWLMFWWTQPTHTVVLGDLLGSQWISDEEFQHRTNRFWSRVFKRGTKIPRSIMESSGRSELLGADQDWPRRIIALAGNHDIGYSGDITEHRLRRFEDAYGKVNWDVTLRLNESRSPFEAPPELRLIILNSMNLDTPALEYDYYKESIDFVTEKLHNTLRPSTDATGTVLLTHIPFHKEAGICVDGPFIDYDFHGRVKEQNHLSKDMSSWILHGLADPNAPGRSITLNGHDHNGCDTFHYYSTNPPTDPDAPDEGSGEWRAKKWAQAKTDGNLKGMREITVRSMMGDFWGNAGLLSAWYDSDERAWKFEYDTCILGVQHIWWAVHVVDIIVLGLGLGGVVVFFLEDETPQARSGKAPPKGKSKKV